MSIVKIYTDGSCLGNPGYGGWACLMMYGDKEKMLSGAEKDTTNNRMELSAAVKALEALKRQSKVEIWTDSQYVRRGVTEWSHSWVRNNWRNSQKKPVKNKDLWQVLIELSKKHDIDWHWVKGHSGDEYNERVDEAARLAAEKLRG